MAVPIYYRYNCDCGGNWQWTPGVEAVEMTFSLQTGEMVDRIFFLTSHLYPVEVVEGLGTSFDLLNARMLGNRTEAVSIAHRLVAGALDVVAGYATLTQDDEAIETSFALLYGALGVVSGVEAYECSDEALETTFTLLSGDLDVVAGYVDHEVNDEAIEVGYALTGGTLA